MLWIWKGDMWWNEGLWEMSEKGIHVSMETHKTLLYYSVSYYRTVGFRKKGVIVLFDSYGRMYVKSKVRWNYLGEHDSCWVTREMGFIERNSIGLEWQYFFHKAVL